MVISTESEDKNKVLAGISYLLLFLGLLGAIIDVIIHYATKNKYAKFHSGQAVWLMIVFLILGLILVGPTIFIGGGGTSVKIAIIYSYAKAGVILVSAIATFAGKEYRIPIAAQLLER